MAAAEDDDGGQKQQQQPSDIIPKTPPTAIGALLPRKGTEIVVAGQLVNANTRVVTFLDADGFSAYTGCPHPTQPSELAMDAPRFGVRRVQTQCVPNSRWTLQALQQQIHQLVVHYDACGTAQKCFKVLHHERGLSCHFIIDLDGVIYQTLGADYVLNLTGALNDKSRWQVASGKWQCDTVLIVVRRGGQRE